MLVTWIGALVVVLVWGGECQKPYSYQYVGRQYDPVFFEDDEANRWVCMVFGLCAAIDTGYGQRSDLGLVYQWSQLEFAYPTPSDRQADVTSETFIPGTPAPIDVDVQYTYGSSKQSRVFVTIPRFQAGIPVTLGIVTDQQLNNNPIIKPYPSWDWHRNPRSCNINRLVSVYRVWIDECQRLWVLDTGRFQEEQTCPPQILAFDLQTDQLIHRYEIPDRLIESRSILVTPVVDVRDAHAQCKDTFVYVADCQTYSIIVYDVQKNLSWKATDKTMYPYPNYGTFSILGDSFDLMDGVLGMSLSPYRPGEERILFYHAMSSPTENWVKTSELRNRTRFLHNPESSPEIFHTYKGERQTQSAAEAIDRDGVMYFGLMSDVTLNCWNTRTEYGPKTTEAISRNRQTMQFVSGIKVVTNNRAKQEVWLMTSRFQKVATGTISSDEINFRIHAGKTDDLTASTICKSGRHIRPGGSGGGYGLYKPFTSTVRNTIPKSSYRT